MSNRLINIPLSAATAPAVAAKADSENSATGSGVINSMQGTITFAGAPTAVFVVWGVLKTVLDEKGWIMDFTFPVLLSIALGLLIYWASEPTGGAQSTTPKARVLGFIFALINSFTIAATAIGVQTTLNPVKTPEPATTVQTK